MRRCKTCVETDTRPTMEFDEEGICLPCRSVSLSANEKINWDERTKVLEDIVTWGKEHKGSGYDCIIGVSGGKDSTRQALFAKELGMNPLLVSYNYPPEQQTIIGAENLANLVELGFDVIRITPSPFISKALMKECFYKLGNLFNASELALYASLPRTAIAYKIPLIFLGENPGLAFGTDVGSKDYNGNQMRKMNTLQGGDPHRFKTDWMSDKDLYWYRYPLDDDRERADLRIVYMGYFLDDFNDHSNAAYAMKHGLKIREGEDAQPDNIGGTGTWTALDDDFVIVNQMLKYMKFGFGKATQEAGVSIRAGLMSRQEGMEIVKAYDGKCAPKYIKQFCSYIDIDEDEFWRVAEGFRDQQFFQKDEENNWQLKDELLV